ncbi:MAG: hypothetical protein A4E23_01677 [Methanomethylovorans sp. PtaU1.Bin073]|nr:MAG: hypothetical protein A4E23_01677 [Methanomethylovorans sp. PtaU1.Bin073]
MVQIKTESNKSIKKAAIILILGIIFILLILRWFALKYMFAYM